MNNWIGVDLDGTLAHYEPGQFPEIGEPIEPMMERVRKWLTSGTEVRIVTARAQGAQKAWEIPRIQKWLLEHGLPSLEVTCEKDFDMIELWDDRAIQVIRNTGQPVDKTKL